jgi:hypothetical protein
VVGGAAQQLHCLLSLGGVVDGVDYGQVLFGGDREQLRHPGQSPRHGQLQCASPMRVEPAQDRLAGAVVAEPHRLVGARFDHQDALVEGRRQQLFHDTRRLAGRGLQHPDRDTPAETRHRLQQLPGPRRYGLDARREQLADLGAAQMGVHGRRVPPPPGGGWGEHAVAA